MNVDGHQGVKDDYANTLSNGGAPGTGNGTANISNTSPTGMDTIASLIVYFIKERAKAIKYQDERKRGCRFRNRAFDTWGIVIFRLLY